VTSFETVPRPVPPQPTASIAQPYAHRPRVSFSPEPPADQLILDDQTITDDESFDDSDGESNTPTDDEVDGYFSIHSLPTLPPYDNDSDLITNFIDDDYELHKILFPGSILHDSACLGNISALSDDDRMWCHVPRPPETQGMTSGGLELVPPDDTQSNIHVNATDETDSIQPLINIPTVSTLHMTSELSDSDIIAMQADDDELKTVIEWLQSGCEPSYDDLRAAPLASRNLWSQKPAVHLQSGVLVRRSDDNVLQLLVPAELRRTLFDINHAGQLAAHLGAERTLQQLRQAYWWPGMKRDVTLWYKECAVCATSKPPPSRPHGPLQKTIAASPMDLVAIDILSGLPTASDGSKCILVVTDFFTKWSECYALPDSEAKTCMDALYNNFFSRFGICKQLHTDQAKNFESLLFQEMCKLTGINKTRTSPMHPRSDGQCERNNRTILQMLRCTAHDNPTDWPQKLPIIMAAYRMSPHKTTGVTPNFAMLGREVLLPSTLMAKPPEEPIPIVVPYAQNFRDNMRAAHTKMRKAIQSAAKTQKTYFDKLVKGPAFHVGQHVWLYWPKPKQRQKNRKLDRAWTGPYVILSFKTSVVCCIEHVHTHKRQAVHTDRLTPCMSPVTTLQPHVTASQPSTDEVDHTARNRLPLAPTSKRRGRPPKSQRQTVPVDINGPEHQCTVPPLLPSFSVDRPRRTRRIPTRLML